MAQQTIGGHHKHMVKSAVNTSNAGERIAQVMLHCRFEEKAQLAKAAGVSPQNLSAWIARDRITQDGAVKIRAATGAGLEWLLSGAGVMFPDGPKVAQRKADDAPAMALTINRLENDIDALRTALAAVVETLIVTTPAAAEGLGVMLDAMDPRFHEHGFYGQIRAAVSRAQKTSATGRADAPRRGAGGSSRRGTAS